MCAAPSELSRARQQHRGARRRGPPRLPTRRAGVILVYRRWHVKSAEAESGAIKVSRIEQRFSPACRSLLRRAIVTLGREQSDCDC